MRRARKEMGEFDAYLRRKFNEWHGIVTADPNPFPRMKLFRLRRK